MKYATFNALNTYVTKSDVDALPNGTSFFWGAKGRSAAGSTNIHGKQAGNTSLRHRITYYTKGTDGVSRMVYDILESNDLGQSSKTALKPKVSTSPYRDDNDRNFIKEGDWS